MTSAAATGSLTVWDASGQPSSRRSPVLLGLRITFSGLLYAGILSLVGLAALNSEASLLFLLFGIGVGVFTFGALAPAWMVRKVAVARTVPEAVVAGRPFTLVYVVHNRRQWTGVWSLIIGEAPVKGAKVRFPRGFVGVLGPGCEQRLELMGNCGHRGRVRLRGVRVLSRFPFGLFSCAVDLEIRAGLTVYPAFGRFRRDPWKDTRYSASSSARAAGEHSGYDEFYGLREYRQGDNLRWVHWRRSARTGELVVREMMALRATQLIVLVDAWPGPPPASGGGLSRRSGLLIDPAVERVISAAATAVCDGLERGHRVGLICRSAVPVVLAPAGGRPHRQRLLQELALIGPGAREGLDELVARIRWSSGWQARCLICATRFDETHERVAGFVQGRAEAVTALSPCSEGFDALLDLSAEPVFDRRGR